MAVSETQLITWSRQGSIAQSSDTYASIRGVLEDTTSNYYSRDFEIFLQGSYGNDTNIWADSDVDLVIKLNSGYYYDLSSLDQGEKELFHSKTSAGDYNFDSFKSDVILQLTSKYGSLVKPGKKAIFIAGSGNRRDADVIPAFQHRRYLGFTNTNESNYVEGICFWASDGTKIINYPKLHSQNCTAKHQSTQNRFKPFVRILKNMRNSMISNGYLEEGIAPSYFLEGMLYNVPNENFSALHSKTFLNSINWLIKCDRAKLECANEQYYLLHPTSPVTWRSEHMQTFLDAVVKFWNELS